MTCAEASERIFDRLYGELGEEARAPLEAHLATCESCRREAEGLERTRSSARAALLGPLAQPAPTLVHERLLEAAAQAVKNRAPAAPPAHAGWAAWLRRPWFFPSFAAVSLIAIFILARPVLLDGPRQRLQERLSAAPAEEPGPPLEAPDPSPRPSPRSAGRGSPEGESGAGRGSLEGASGAGRGSLEGLSGAREESAERASKATAARFTSPPPRSPSPPRPLAKKRSTADESSPPPAPSAPAQAPLGQAPPPLPPTSLAPRSGERVGERGPAGSGAASVGATANRQPTRFATPPPPAALEISAGAEVGSAAEPKRQEPIPAPQKSESREESAARRAAAAAAAAERRAAAGRAADLDTSLTEREAAPRARLFRAPAPTSPPAAMPAAADQPVPLATLIERADRHFAAGEWQPAAAAYRELIQRFPGHARVPVWRQRLEAATRSPSR